MSTIERIFRCQAKDHAEGCKTSVPQPKDRNQLKAMAAKLASQQGLFTPCFKAGKEVKVESSKKTEVRVVDDNTIVKVACANRKCQNGAEERKVYDKETKSYIDEVKVIPVVAKGEVARKDAAGWTCSDECAQVVQAKKA